MASQEEVLKTYKQKTEELIEKMHRLVIRVSRMADNEKYRKTLEKLQTIK